MEIDKTLKYKTGIYQLTIDKHIYVGSSVNLLFRLRRHYNDLKRGKHDNQYLQRSVDKYGIDLLSYSILEILPDDISTLDLLKKEKYYIDLKQADLNLKKDPVTQQGCITTCIPVYQFDQFGKLLKKWNSETEAAEFYKLHSSNIAVACKKPERQRSAAGFLWSYLDVYEYPLKIIYVYDLNGNFLSMHQDTIDIYNTYFSNIARKTVLSQLKKKIDSNVPYKHIYLSSSDSFVPDKKPKDLTLLNYLKKYNPIINVYNDKGALRFSKHFLEIKNTTSLRSKIEKEIKIDFSNSINVINLNVDNAKKNVKIIAKELKTNKETKYDSITKAVIDIFGKFDEDIYRNIIKHMKRNTPYKGFLFIRDL